MATRAGKAKVRTNKEQHIEVQLAMNLKGQVCDKVEIFSYLSSVGRAWEQGRKGSGSEKSRVCLHQTVCLSNYDIVCFSVYIEKYIVTSYVCRQESSGALSSRHWNNYSHAMCRLVNQRPRVQHLPTYDPHVQDYCNIFKPTTPSTPSRWPLLSTGYLSLLGQSQFTWHESSTCPL